MEGQVEDQAMDKQPKIMSRIEYEEWMAKQPKDLCAFCEWKKNQIVIYEGYKWLWVANLAPYWKIHTLLVPKRHFKEYGEMTNSEAVEFKQLIDKAIKKYETLGVERFVHFWRKRKNSFDPKTGKKKVDHFHVHLCDDFDGMWDPILDDKAKEWDVNIMR